MRTLYIECNMGAAGDMLMSALYELMDEEQKEEFLKRMNGLGLPGVRITPRKSSTCGISGTHMEVTVYGEEEREPGGEHAGPHTDHHGHEHAELHADHYGHEHAEPHPGHHGHGHEEMHGDHHGHDHTGHAGHHHHADPLHIAELIGGLDLPEEVRDNAGKVYDAIADAEAKAHGCPVEQVHFHEVGALDAVADVTGVCYAIYLLRPERIVASPVHVGSGTVRCAHGIMPVPAPATANLLADVPMYGGNIRGELCTPTGAALLVHFADSFGDMPVMSKTSVGIGVGTKEFEQANCVRVFLGEAQSMKETNATETIGETAEEQFQDVAAGNGRIAELVCNIDDMTPEALAFAKARLIELGALDAYTVAGTMKKGRPGWELTVLCETGRIDETAKNIMRETTTNGVRVRICEKYFLTPGIETVQTECGQVRIKTAEGFGIRHEKPEYEDTAAHAKKAQMSYREAYEHIISLRNEQARKEQDENGQDKGADQRGAQR